MTIKQVTFLGSPVEVKGEQPLIGTIAPDTLLVNNKRETVKLYEILRRNTTIISVVPNVLTRTCEIQTKKFEEKTREQGFEFITVGRNTVDEFNSWNEKNGLNVNTFTDSNGSFGRAYGLDIELEGEARTARAVIVIDEKRTIQYFEVVPEIADEPYYEEALAVAIKLSND